VSQPAPWYNRGDDANEGVQGGFLVQGQQGERRESEMGREHWVTHTQRERERKGREKGRTPLSQEK
jgi:hypothetical protein